jgi:orotidine-5'-phosphate decarboxylase
MSATSELKEIQRKNDSMLCVGLDLDRKKIPPEFATTTKGLYNFAVAIIEATSDLIAAYKMNMAFFCDLGTDGLSLLEKIIQRIPDELVVILDGKWGDIGNTAAHYAAAAFERFKADWVTLNPYMGYDSIRPFLDYKDKGAFILCLTSNPGSRDFQFLHVLNKPIYMFVAEKAAYWNKEDNLGLVVGATHHEQLAYIRKAADDLPILIPGVGAQGGDLERAIIAGTDNFKRTALITISRSITYASQESNFAAAARSETEKMNSIIRNLQGKNRHESESERSGS